MGNRRAASFANFDYITSRFEIGQHALVAGGYYANYAYEGAGRNAGFMAGADLVMIPDKLHFIADFISGNSALSVVNAGLELEVWEKWGISVAAQLPAPGSETPAGAVFQLSWN